MRHRLRLFRRTRRRLWATSLPVALLIAALGIGHASTPRARAEPAQLEEENPAYSETLEIVLPAGDPAEGKRVFSEFLCEACHQVSDDPDFRTMGTLGEGPDLALSSAKPAGYIVTAIIAPSHDIPPDPDTQKRFRNYYGDSVMPSFNETLTVRGLVDLVAYLTSSASTP